MNYTTNDPSDLMALVSAVVSAFICGLMLML